MLFGFLMCHREFCQHHRRVVQRQNWSVGQGINPGCSKQLPGQTSDKLYFQSECHFLGKIVLENTSAQLGVHEDLFCKFQLGNPQCMQVHKVTSSRCRVHTFTSCTSLSFCQSVSPVPLYGTVTIWRIRYSSPLYITSSLGPSSRIFMNKLNRTGSCIDPWSAWQPNPILFACFSDIPQPWN